MLKLKFVIIKLRADFITEPPTSKKMNIACINITSDQLKNIAAREKMSHTDDKMIPLPKNIIEPLHKITHTLGKTTHTMGEIIHPFYKIIHTLRKIIHPHYKIIHPHYKIVHPLNKIS